jgi:hypothetical protein
VDNTECLFSAAGLGEAVLPVRTAPLCNSRDKRHARSKLAAAHQFWSCLFSSGSCHCLLSDRAFSNGYTGPAGSCRLPGPDHYREQAARFRQLAAVLSDDRLTREMLRLAAAYETKAVQLEAQIMIGAHTFRSK